MKHRIRYRTLFDSNSHIHGGQIECRRFMVLFRPEGLITHTPANVRQSPRSTLFIWIFVHLRNWKTSSSFVLFAQRAIYLARELCITYSVSVFANQKPDEVVDLHQTVCSRNLCDTHSDAECLLSAALPPHHIHFWFWRWKNYRWAIYSSIEFRHFSEYFLTYLEIRVRSPEPEHMDERVCGSILCNRWSWMNRTGLRKGKNIEREPKNWYSSHVRTIIIQIKNIIKS